VNKKVSYKGANKFSAKRFLSALIGLFIVAVFLSSCEGFRPELLTPVAKDSPTPTEARLTPSTPGITPTPAPTSTPTPIPTSSFSIDNEDLHGLILDFWYISGDPITSENIGRTVQALVQEFNRQNLYGFYVVPTEFSDYGLLYETLHNSLYGDLPDLFMGHNYQAARLDGTGHVLVDLEPYVGDPVWGFTPEERSDFFPLFWKQDLYEEKRLGIPFYRLAQVLYYNQSWAQELGFDQIPVTPEMFKEQACAAAVALQASDSNASAGEGGWAINIDTPTLLAWFNAFGAQVAHPEQEAYNFDSPEVRDALAFLKELQDSGCAWAPQDNHDAYFAKRRALFISGSLMGFQDQRDAFNNSDNSDRWTALAYPSNVNRPSVLAYGPSLSIIQSGEEQQMATWLFLKWLISPENQAFLIQNHGTLPVRASSTGFLEDYRNGNPQWAAAYELHPYVRVEPPFPSWRVVRWSVSDAGKFLFSSTGTSARISALISELNNTAAELHSMMR
jgi:multiple sugar transport system substrate-binding protein